MWKSKYYKWPVNSHKSYNSYSCIVAVAGYKNKGLKSFKSIDWWLSLNSCALRAKVTVTMAINL